MNTEHEIHRSRSGTHRISKRTMSMVMVLALLMSMVFPIVAQAASVKVRQGQYRGSHSSFKTNDWQFEGYSCYYPKCADNGGKQGDILYCIEPVGVINENTGSMNNVSVSNTLKTAMNSNGKNDAGINASQLEDLMGRICLYGSHGTAKFHIGNTKYNPDTPSKQWLATQLLIWEALVGQRDADFNYVAPKSGKPVAQTYANGNWSAVKPYYDEYAKAVQDSIKNSKTPSFMYDTEDEAEQKARVFPNSDNSTHTMELTDENGTLGAYTLTFPEGVEGTVSGNTLKLTATKELPDTVTITGVNKTAKAPKI